MNPLNQKEIRSIIDYSLTEWDMSGFPVDVEWNNRFTRRIGDAIIMPGGRGRIRLSTKLFPLLSKEKAENTIIHESSHIIARELFPMEVARQKKGGHGATWFKVHKKIGGTPSRYACQIQGADQFRRKVDRVTAYCGCGPIDITVTRRTKMRRGHSYRCRKCRKTLSLSKFSEAEKWLPELMG